MNLPLIKNLQFDIKKVSISMPLLFSSFSLLKQFILALLFLFRFKHLMHILSLFTDGNFDARECVTTTEGKQKDFS